MPLKRWVRTILVAAVLVAIIGTMLVRVINAAFIQHYSRDWRSSSSAEARAQGVLARVPVLAADSFSSARATYRVDDLWIEHVSRIQYRYYLFRRRVLEPRYRLIVHYHAEHPAGHASGLVGTQFSEQLMYNDSAGFTDRATPISGRAVLFALIEAPLPDTVRLWLRPDDQERLRPDTARSR